MPSGYRPNTVSMQRRVEEITPQIPFFERMLENMKSKISGQDIETLQKYHENLEKIKELNNQYSTGNPQVKNLQRRHYQISEILNRINPRASAAIGRISTIERHRGNRMPMSNLFLLHEEWLALTRQIQAIDRHDREINNEVQRLDRENFRLKKNASPELKQIIKLERHIEKLKSSLAYARAHLRNNMSHMEARG
jgi:predicted  nucleic acid-binding Zn-ribbon protein